MESARVGRFVEPTQKNLSQALPELLRVGKKAVETFFSPGCLSLCACRLPSRLTFCF
jgi:hypothetical protein